MTYNVKVNNVTAVLLNVWYELKPGSYSIEHVVFTWDDGEPLFDTLHAVGTPTAFYTFTTRDGEYHMGPLTDVHGYVYTPE